MAVLLLATLSPHAQKWPLGSLGPSQGLMDMGTQDWSLGFLVRHWCELLCRTLPQVRHLYDSNGSRFPAALGCLESLLVATGMNYHTIPCCKS